MASIAATACGPCQHRFAIWKWIAPLGHLHQIPLATLHPPFISVGASVRHALEAGVQQELVQAVGDADGLPIHRKGAALFPQGVGEQGQHPLQGGTTGEAHLALGQAQDAAGLEEAPALSQQARPGGFGQEPDQEASVHEIEGVVCKREALAHTRIS